MLRGGSFIAEERRGGEGCMDTWRLGCLIWVGLNLRLEFTGFQNGVSADWKRSDHT
jgi:hypothetical protein